MKPIKFSQSNKTLMRPVEMTDEKCSSLDIWVGPGRDEVISCWRPSWRERLAIFFGKPVWLLVWGRHHPPVALEVHSPFD